MKGASSRPTKRLIFDRRYGWIVDEWKDPAEEALAGGRGIFRVNTANCPCKYAEVKLLIASSAVKYHTFLCKILGLVCHQPHSALNFKLYWFCMLPIAKSLVKLSLLMVNYGLDSANQFLKNSNQTSSTLSSAGKSNWFSEIKKMECTAELELPTSKMDTATL